jgi:hypothetical protein
MSKKKVTSNCEQYLEELVSEHMAFGELQRQSQELNVKRETLESQMAQDLKDIRHEIFFSDDPYIPRELSEMMRKHWWQIWKPAVTVYSTNLQPVLNEYSSKYYATQDELKSIKAQREALAKPLRTGYKLLRTQVKDMYKQIKKISSSDMAYLAAYVALLQAVNYNPKMNKEANPIIARLIDLRHISEEAVPFPIENAEGYVALIKYIKEQDPTILMKNPNAKKLEGHFLTKYKAYFPCINSFCPLIYTKLPAQPELVLK